VCEDKILTLTYEIKQCSLRSEEEADGRIFLHEFLFLMYNSWDLGDALERANYDPAVPKICYSDIANKEYKGPTITTPAAIKEREELRS